jgi:hypothetical protein
MNIRNKIIRIIVDYDQPSVSDSFYRAYFHISPNCPLASSAETTMYAEALHPPVDHRRYAGVREARGLPVSCVHDGSALLGGGGAQGGPPAENLRALRGRLQVPPGRRAPRPHRLPQVRLRGRDVPRPPGAPLQHRLLRRDRPPLAAQTQTQPPPLPHGGARARRRGGLGRSADAVA